MDDFESQASAVGLVLLVILAIVYYFTFFYEDPKKQEDLMHKLDRYNIAIDYYNKYSIACQGRQISSVETMFSIMNAPVLSVNGNQAGGFSGFGVNMGGFMVGEISSSPDTQAREGCIREHKCRVRYLSLDDIEKSISASRDAFERCV